MSSSSAAEDPDIHQAKEKREKERKKEAQKFWEERDEEDLGEGLMNTQSNPRSTIPPEQAQASQPAAGKLIGHLSSKHLSVLDKPAATEDAPFSRQSVDDRVSGPQEEVRPPKRCQVQA